MGMNHIHADNCVDGVINMINCYNMMKHTHTKESVW